MPSGARSRNLLFHRQALCQLSYRHHDGEEWGGRVSRVLFPMVISLGPEKGPATSSPSWRLSTSGLGEQPASGRFGDCCGEDCPFHPGKPVLVSVALARSPARQSGLSTRGSPRASPAFTGHPCSVQLGLSSGAEAPATILAHPMPRLSTCSGFAVDVRVSGCRGVRGFAYPVTLSP